MATERRVSWIITANVKQWQKGLNKAQRRMDRFGRKMQRAGRSLTQNVTVPIAGAAAASIKMASDFESSMTRIETLVGLSRDQVQGMRKDVLALAGETAQAPKELSEALFAVTSAGIRGAEAMEVLEMAAKASAIGLGETREIARATTAILQAYGKENINAAEATDKLTAIVREGNLEASELAPVLGRVVGIASQLDVSFSEVGASIATFTRLGVSAEEAVTGLRGIMNALLKPTAQGRKALDKVGLSFKELRQQVSEDGLTAVLRNLISAFDGNIEGLSKVIPRVRALAAVMGTAGAQGEEYSQILQNIEQSAGIVNSGLDRVSGTTQFKFNNALSNLTATAIEFGTVMLPIVNKMLGRVQALAEQFQGLSRETKENIIQWGMIAAAAGPVLFIFGSIVRLGASVVGAFRGIVGAAKFLAKGLGGLFRIITKLPAFVRLMGMRFRALGRGILWFGKSVIWGSAVAAFQKLYAIFRLVRLKGIIPMAKAMAAAAAPFVLAAAKIGAVIAVAGGLVLVAKSIYDAWDTVGPFFAQLWDKIVGTFASGVQQIAKLMMKMPGMEIQGAQIIAQMEAIKSKAQERIEARGIVSFKDTMSTVFEEMKENAVGSVQFIKNSFSNLSAWVSGLVPDFSFDAGGEKESKGLDISLPESTLKNFEFATKLLNNNLFPALERTNQKWKQLIETAKWASSVLSGEWMAAVDSAAGGMQRVQNQATRMQRTISRGLDRMVEDMLVGIGRMLAGLTTFQNAFKGMKGIGMGLLDSLANLAVRVGKIAIGIGVGIQAIKKALESLNPYVAIAAGAALIALGSWARSALSKAADQKRQSMSENTRSVNDALIRSDGSVVEFHPDDNILAMKDFSKLGMAGGGAQTLNNNLFLDGSVVWRNQRRVNYKRGR